MTRPTRTCRPERTTGKTAYPAVAFQSSSSKARISPRHGRPAGPLAASPGPGAGTPRSSGVRPAQRGEAVGRHLLGEPEVPGQEPNGRGHVVHVQGYRRCGDLHKRHAPPRFRYFFSITTRSLRWPTPRVSGVWHLTSCEFMADSYLTFAADYDWLFDDDVLTHGGAINYPAIARLLKQTRHAATVLDASCGTGINAAALARRG